MEGLRLYPIGHLSRVCVKEYTFKDVGVTVKPGTQVMVPSITMMRYAQVSTQPLAITFEGDWCVELGPTSTRRNPQEQTVPNTAMHDGIEGFPLQEK